jgi:hypothetical protein
MPRAKLPTTQNSEFDYDALGPKAATTTRNVVERIQSRCHAFSVAIGYDLCDVHATY